MSADRRFEPSTITIDAGTKLLWKNDSNEPHTVTAYLARIPDPSDYFASMGDPPLTGSRKDPEQLARSMVADGLLTAGESYSVEFVTPGTYEYFCIPHEDQGMKGTVVVEG